MLRSHPFAQAKPKSIADFGGREWAAWKSMGKKWRQPSTRSIWLRTTGVRGSRLREIIWWHWLLLTIMNRKIELEVDEKRNP